MENEKSSEEFENFQENNNEIEKENKINMIGNKNKILTKQIENNQNLEKNEKNSNNKESEEDFDDFENFQENNEKIVKSENNFEDEFENFQENENNFEDNLKEKENKIKNVNLIIEKFEKMNFSSLIKNKIIGNKNKNEKEIISKEIQSTNNVEM